MLYGRFPKSEVAGKVPLRTYRGVDGSAVEYWRMGAAGHDPKRDRWLIFNFEPWYVLVWDEKGAMTEQQLAAWARGLIGTKTEGGLLMLSARGPLRLATAGEKAGPEMTFYERGKTVGFFVGRCQSDEDDGNLFALGGETAPGAEWFGSRCFEGQSLTMHVQSENERFARGVIDGVEIRDVDVAL